MSIEKVRPYMSTLAYNDPEKAVSNVKKLLDPSIAAAIAEVARMGDKAPDVAKEMAAIAFAQISYGKRNIPFGVLLRKEQKTKRSKIKVSSVVVSDPYYHTVVPITDTNPVYEYYERNKSELTLLTESANDEYYLARLLERQNLNPHKPDVADYNLLANKLGMLPLGIFFIYGHDEQGGRFHIKTLNDKKRA